MELRCEFGLRFDILAFATSRFRGNDKAVFLVYRQEPHGPGPRPPRRPAAGHWLCGHAMPRVRLNLLRGSLRKRGFIRSSLPTFYEVQTLSKDTGQLNAKMKSILPSQVSFAQAEYDKKKKRTRRELFLEQMEQVVPWARLIEVIEPHYPKGGKRGRPPIGLERMLRMYFVQQWYALADEAVEDAVYDSQALRNFMSIDLSQQSVPDATTLMGFRHLLEANDLPQAMLVEVNAMLIERGLLMSKGTLVDATLIAAPSSTKNQAHARDPEMHQAKKGNSGISG